MYFYLLYSLYTACQVIRLSSEDLKMRKKMIKLVDKKIRKTNFLALQPIYWLYIACQVLHLFSKDLKELNVYLDLMMKKSCQVLHLFSKDLKVLNIYLDLIMKKIFQEILS